MTRSPSAIRSQTVTRRPGNARRSVPQTCLKASAPVAPVGTDARNSTSGSTISSITFAVSSGSPLFTASTRRRNVALWDIMGPLWP
jgi:hypothetical protein